MVNILLIVAGSYLVGELYKKFATPEQKRKWEGLVRMHHGEAGAIMAGAGMLAKSPSLTATGIGLMLHDRSDAGKWFRNR